ncbi:MAG: hypothetical protein DRO01_00880 [Thermoproteota archaeon]|nr:MAG: hypothetical protein DRO01_00880 [Candidatus Korarchaeota archaeon]
MASVKIARRDFLKVAAVTGALATLSGPEDVVIRTLKKVEAKALEPQEYTVPGLCRMCVNSCGTFFRVKDGKLHKIDPNPNNPANAGNLCARGQAGVRRVYNPDRLKRPMIRRDKSLRGTWQGFEATDWNTALDEAAAALKKYIDAGEAKSIMVGGGWLPCGVYKPYVVAFAKAIGTPNFVGSPPPMCFFPKAFAWTVTIGAGGHPHIRADHEYASYIILLRRNLAGSIGVPYAWQFARAKKRGAKIVVLDPRMSESAALADLWVPIRPGTDLAFLLAMGHVIVNEGLYDEEFLKKHTNAPMLLKADTNTPAKTWDDPDTGKKKYLVYDEATGEAKAHDEALQPALTGEFDVEIDGETVRVKTAFQALVERLQQYTPEWASQICDVPAETIVQVAREFGTIKPAVIDPGWHDPKYQNSVQTWRMVAVLNALVGNIDKPGGLIFNAAGRSLKSSALPDARADVQWMKKKGIIVSTAQPMILAYYDAIVNGDPYPIKAAVLTGGNWIRTLPDDRKWKEAFKKLEDVIAIDVMPNDTVSYADIILPDTTYPERDDPMFGVGFSPDAAVATSVKAIDPIYDCRPMIDILVQLADRLGKKDAYFENLGKMLGVDGGALKSAYESEGIAGIRRVQVEAKGVSYDEIVAKGAIVLKTRDQLIGTMPYKKPLGTPSGKVEVYSLKMAGIMAKKGYSEHWDPIPTWIPPRVMDGVGGNVFYLAYGRSPIASHTHTTDNDLLASIGRPEHFGVWINSAKAAELGIRDGDMVRLTSLATGQSVVAKAFVTDGVRPDTVFTVSAWGAESEELRVARRIGGVALNKLWPMHEDLFTLLPNAMTQEVLVRVEKA